MAAKEERKDGNLFLPPRGEKEIHREEGGEAFLPKESRLVPPRTKAIMQAGKQQKHPS